MFIRDSRVSTDKQNTWSFVNFCDQSDQNVKDSCEFWQKLQIFGLKLGILVHKVRKSTILSGKLMFYFALPETTVTWTGTQKKSQH